MKTGIELIEDEIYRQIDVHGYTDYHIQNSPEDYANGQLGDAAACYAMTIDPHTISDDLFPWPDEYWKPSPDNRIRELVKAGAMIVREINRLTEAPVLTIYQARHDTLGYWYNLSDKAEYDGLEELGTYQLRILQT